MASRRCARWWSSGPMLAAVVMLLVTAACSSSEIVPVTVASGGAASSSDDSTGDNAVRFEPVDAEPGDSTTTPTPRPVTPTAVAIPNPPAPPTPIPTTPPIAAPPTVPTPPAPPGSAPPPSTPAPQDLLPPGATFPPPAGGPFGAVVNDCDVTFPNPALFVWGLPAGVDSLTAHTAPSASAPIVHQFDATALAQGMTGGCRLGDDGLPWFEFFADATMAYADSRYLVQAHLACLSGPVDGRRSPDAAPEVSWAGDIAGHAFTDGGPWAAFIPNTDIGMTDQWWLVPSEHVVVSPVVTTPCSPEVIAMLDDVPQPVTSQPISPPFQAPDPIIPGDCSSGPAPAGPGLGPTLLLDLDQRDPIDALVPVSTYEYGGELVVTYSVRIGTVDGIDDAPCRWLHVTEVREGRYVGAGGVTADHSWFCIDGMPTQLVQRVTHSAGGAPPQTFMHGWVVVSALDRIGLDPVPVSADEQPVTTCSIALGLG